MFLQRDKDILNILKSLSETVNPEVKSFRIVSALADSKGNIISFGFPRRKTHPLQKEISLNDSKAFLHAEVDCIIRGHRKIPRGERKDTVLYVHRSKFHRVGKEEYVWVNGMAKPCESCQKLIEKLALKRVFFSTEQGYELL